MKDGVAGGNDFTLVDTKLGKREIGLQQIEYLYYIVCWLGREYRFRHFGIHSSACSDKHVAIYEFEQMPQQEDLLMSMLLQRLSDKSSILKS